MKLRPLWDGLVTFVSVLAIASALVGCAGKAPPPVDKGMAAPEAGSYPGVPQPEPLGPLHQVTDRVAIRTSVGTIVVGLYGNDAPNTVANFLSYVEQNFYGGTIFHRVIPGFMVQGGGFDPQLNRAETREPIQLEIIPGLKHEPGVVSMARTSNPHSATSQFFICVARSPQLNGGYAAFGKVEEGMDVATTISTVPTHTADGPTQPMDDVPVTPIIIESITRVE
jgi:cyclophilin family peptidyl-prolyl cis-trans isomerase